MMKTVGDLLATMAKCRPQGKKKRGVWRPPSLSLTETQNLLQHTRILAALSKVVNEALLNEVVEESKKKKEIRDFVESLCRNLLERNVLRLSRQEVGVSADSHSSFIVRPSLKLQ